MGNKSIMYIRPEGYEIGGTVTLRTCAVLYLFQYTRKDCRRLNQPLMDTQSSVLKYKFVTLKVYMARRVQQTLTLVFSDHL